MDGEDFQLNPIMPESEPMEAASAGSIGSSSSLPQTHRATPQSFSNIVSLFQPLSSPSQAQSHYQPQPAASWASGEKRSSSQRNMDHRAESYMMGHMQNPPYQAPASTPLSSMGGRQNLQWPPDPLLTYQQQAGVTKGYLIDTLSGDERPSCQQNTTHLMQKQR